MSETANDDGPGGLTLTLRPREKFLVGGNLVENGPKRSAIRVLNDVFVLRLQDALHPDEIDTPVKRAYHAAQMILACEVSVAAGQVDLLARLIELARLFGQTEGAGPIARALEQAQAQRFHGVLQALKALLPIEEALRGEHDTASDAASCAIAGQR